MKPCTVLGESRAHSGKVAACFARIAKRYDLANRLLSVGTDMVWRGLVARRVAAGFVPGSRRRVLDLAAGTLDISLALTRRVPGVQVLAVDFCLPMLLAGKEKLHKADEYARRRVHCVAADGLALPLADASVDAVTVAFGVRNMSPRSRALAEAHRVLTPGGILYVLEFGAAREPLWGGLYNVYLEKILPAVGGVIARDKAAYDYLAASIRQFPAAAEFGEELREAGFRSVSWESIFKGIVYLHCAQK